MVVGEISQWELDNFCLLDTELWGQITHCPVVELHDPQSWLYIRISWGVKKKLWQCFSFFYSPPPKEHGISKWLSLKLK